MNYFTYLVLVPLSMIGLQLCGIVDWLKRRLYYLKYTKNSRYVPFRLKPFDCEVCLSFWMVLYLSRDAFTAFAAYSLCYVYSRLIERV